jgi:hypothetical protein
MIKIVMVQQRFELLCDITANIIVRALNFSDELFAAIDEEKNVLHITASQEIIIAAAEIRLQLCCHEQFRREASDIQRIGQRASDRRFNAFGVPAIAEAENAFEATGL